MRLQVLEAPSGDVLLVQDAKDHLGLNSSDHDAKLPDLIAAAESQAATFTGRQFLRARYGVVLDRWPCAIELPRPPLISVDTITYVDGAGSTQTLASNQYVVDTSGLLATIRPAYGVTWPVPRLQASAITVAFTCGYATTGASVPRWARTGIKLLLEDLFDEQPNDLSLAKTSMVREAALRILRPYKVRSTR